MQPEQLITKIRENLLEQRKRLQDYLEILESEKRDISKKDINGLESHIVLEKRIIEELESFKKVLAPMELVYYNSPYKKDTLIKQLTESINRLAGSVKEKSRLNTDELDTILTKLKADINSKDRKRAAERTGYGLVEPVLVDISG